MCIYIYIYETNELRAPADVREEPLPNELRPGILKSYFVDWAQSHDSADGYRLRSLPTLAARKPSRPLLTACCKAAKSSFPLPHPGPYHLESTTLSDPHCRKPQLQTFPITPSSVKQMLAPDTHILGLPTRHLPPPNVNVQCPQAG